MTVPSDDTTTDLHAVIAALRTERDAALAQRNSEYDERIAHQSATIDVLKAMSASPGDPQSVFELIACHANQLCHGAGVALFEFDGRLVHYRSDTGVPLDPEARERYLSMFPMVPSRNSISCRAILEKRVVHVPDFQADPELHPAIKSLGWSAQLSVPLMREGLPIGVITIVNRTGPFSEPQIALLKTFAEQAVIAIASAETYRALQERTAALAQRNTEYGERIEHQSATIDVLKAMSASPGDPQPVFDLIVDRARDICDAYGSTVFEYDGTLIHWRAATGVSDDPAVRAAYEAQFPMAPTRGWHFGRTILDRRIIRIDDMEAEPGLDATLRSLTAKSNVTTPIMRGDEVIGAISMGSREKGGFSESQVELLKTFAEQAAIAITSAETYRALQTRTSDLQETLEYQTAISDVLKVISRSAFDLQPVLDIVVTTAARLCTAEMAAIGRREGDLYRLAAHVGYPSEFIAAMQSRGAFRPLPDNVGGRTALDGRVHHVHDAAAEPGYSEPSIRLGKQRTCLGVPLVRNGEVIGVLVLARQRVEPFTARQIELVSTFADQAVIAIENTRLMTEQREALEQQTATAEVLQVINASPGNLVPVFDAILEKAHTLCEAEKGSLNVYDGERFRAVATHGLSPEYAAMLRAPQSKPPGSPPDRLLRGETIVQVADASVLPFPIAKAATAMERVRTILYIPLRKDTTLAGYITVYRQEVRAFTNKQIALLQNFADQAVIAMENARLLNEQREALERQTAMAEVLQVINASPGDLMPVFDAILEKAMRLCGAAIGGIYRYDGQWFHPVALRGVTPGFAAFSAEHPVPSGSNSAPVRILRTKRPAQIPDLADGSDYTRGMVELGGIRALLDVPLLKEDALLGFIAIYREKPGVFPDKQIALLENFAAQAVIAMENARLLTEQREALEQQTATAEVLQVINASPGDLAPVFEAILEKAHRLCDATLGSIVTFDGEHFRAEATHGYPERYDAWMRGGWRAHPQSAQQALIEGKPFVHVADLGAPGPWHDDEFQRTFIEATGVRTFLVVPLRKDGSLLGFIAAHRKEARAFTDKEITLLENFAAQAVIAMENARLLNDQREALEQQTATAEVLQVINTHPGNLVPVFDAMLNKAVDLCEAAFGILLTYDGECFHHVAFRSIPEAYVKFMREHPPIYPPESAPGRLALGERLVHMLDITDTNAYRSGEPNRRAMADLAGARTVLSVALCKDEVLLGVLTLFREEVRAFTDKQIALLQNFAAQAVIAMENARLLDEIRQRQEELRVTFENMGDGVALFDETRHLVASNRRFQDMLDVPDDVIASRPTFSDYIHYLADHGEYGPDPDDHVQQLLALGSQRRAFERTRPNGRIIEVRVNPVPGGGFVVIYSDITERKRNEEEIRTARDAAEEASRTIEAAYRELKTAQANLIQAEKMASLGQLTAGIAHEIKNPLNFVNNFAELSGDLLDELNDAVAGNRQAEIDELTATLQGNLAKITEHGKRADGIVKAMLEHSRGSSGERRLVDLNTLIDEALNLAYHGARAQDQSFNITLERDFAEGIAPIELAPQDMTRVFLNLFSNGFYAATRRARSSVDAGFIPTLKVTTREIGEAVEVRVRDNGIGISADIRDKLFQPFFTTKPTGEGTGLGLSISYDIVTQQHGGSIAVDSKVGEYSEFTIRLPRSR